MSDDFEAQIHAWTEQSRLRMMAVARDAAQEVTEQVLKPRAKGGRMPVDTGYLRNSAHADINVMPEGDSFYDSSDAAGERVAESTASAILRFQAGDKYYLGFTANYARYMEAKYAFIRLAAQNWDRTVSESVRRVRRQYDDAI